MLLLHAFELIPGVTAQHSLGIRAAQAAGEAKVWLPSNPTTWLARNGAVPAAAQQRAAGSLEGKLLALPHVDGCIVIIDPVIELGAELHESILAQLREEVHVINGKRLLRWDPTPLAGNLWQGGHVWPSSAEQAMREAVLGQKIAASGNNRGSKHAYVQRITQGQGF